jgi:hypothetical protein
MQLHTNHGPDFADGDDADHEPIRDVGSAPYHPHKVSDGPSGVPGRSSITGFPDAVTSGRNVARDGGRAGR